MQYKCKTLFIYHLFRNINGSRTCYVYLFSDIIIYAKKKKKRPHKYHFHLRLRLHYCSTTLINNIYITHKYLADCLLVDYEDCSKLKKLGKYGIVQQVFCLFVDIHLEHLTQMNYKNLFLFELLFGRIDH